MSGSDIKDGIERMSKVEFTKQWNLIKMSRSYIKDGTEGMSGIEFGW